jgi:phospholipase/carboxylesterase
LAESTEIILKMVREEVKKLGNSNKIFLGGFSEGCGLALSVYLQYDDGPFGGVVGCHGSNVADIDWTKINLKIKKETPVLLYHGENDPYIPNDFAWLSY